MPVPMKNISTLIFTINEFANEKPELINVDKLLKEEQVFKTSFLNKLDSFEVEPRKEVVDSLMKRIKNML